MCWVVFHESTRERRKSASGILKEKVNTFIDLAENPNRYLIFFFMISNVEYLGILNDTSNALVKNSSLKNRISVNKFNFHMSYKNTK